METTETELNSPEHFATPDMVLTEHARYYLHQAGRWAQFLGIVGFVFTALILILALFIGTIMASLSALQPSAIPMAGAGGLMSFFYILIAIFYFFFSLYLFQFGGRVKSGIAFSDHHRVTSGLGKLKSFFKLWGITTIVILSLYILILVITLIIGVGAASMLGR